MHNIFSILTLVISVVTFWYILNLSVTKITERHTCPYCYGEGYCAELENKIFLSYNSLTALTYNLLSVKNVYFANNGRYDVVIKKLGSSSKLKQIGKHIIRGDRTLDLLSLRNVLTSPYSDFQVCNNPTADQFLQVFHTKNYENLWTIININAEPLLLELFDNQYFAVPKLLGYCGRAVVEKYSGFTLNNIKKLDWYKRANVARQLLNAADKFTFDHAQFRLYLTDISPDNIAVNDDLNISFVDLGNAILMAKNGVVNETHYTEPFNEEEYGFSKQEICGRVVSDHNVYSVCKLLLSATAPWPMMENGLLHSPPSNLNTKELFENIERCVYTSEKTSRFYLSTKIQQMLNNIVTAHEKIFNK